MNDPENPGIAIYDANKRGDESEREEDEFVLPADDGALLKVGDQFKFTCNC